MDEHDIHNFVIGSQKQLADEYHRIQKRATEDPGTAGDQGEENWATLLRQWLPSYFHVVTKGRILAENGFASPQVDVLVLMPSYPKILLDKKLYLAGGVAAAFECKTTLKASHIADAIETAAILRRNLPMRDGSPYHELHSTVIYGLLAHSHSWKGEHSTPIDNVTTKLIAEDACHVRHPRECLDFLCVADLASWSIFKNTYMSPRLPNYKDYLEAIYGPNGCANTSYVCHAIGADTQEKYFAPIGQLLSGLFSKLSWTFPDMRRLDEYFRRVKMQGSGSGQMRQWNSDIYSRKIRNRVVNGSLSNGKQYDEWSVAF